MLSRNRDVPDAAGYRCFLVRGRRTARARKHSRLHRHKSRNFWLLIFAQRREFLSPVSLVVAVCCLLSTIERSRQLVSSRMDAPAFLSGGKNCSGKRPPFIFILTLSDPFVPWLARRLWISHEFHGREIRYFEYAIIPEKNRAICSFREIFILMRNYACIRRSNCRRKIETNIRT